jgi:hypothetical protein
MGVQLREDRFGVVSLPLVVGALGGTSAVEKDLPCPGIRVGDFVLVNPGVATAGVAYTARVSANDLIKVNCINVTAGSPNPGTVQMSIFYFSPEGGPTKNVVR